MSNMEILGAGSNQTETGGQDDRGSSRKWGFVNGESHTELEDAILDSIDAERKPVLHFMDKHFTNFVICEDCHEQKGCTLVRGKMLCTRCRRALIHVLPTKAKKQEATGPYFAQSPDRTEPDLLLVDNKMDARAEYCRVLGRKSLPAGTRIWPATPRATVEQREAA